METSQIKWINVKDRLPNNFDDVLIKTDCKDCPLLPATYLDGFVLYGIIQCDHHYKTHPKFRWLKKSTKKEVVMYIDRIVEWALLPKPPKKEKNNEK